MRIAVIGAGISGLTSAWLLSVKHNVTIFEKNDWMGGHAHTADVIDARGHHNAIDTGFMVYNPREYPHLQALFSHLSVPTRETSMSFSVSMDDGAFEFSSNVPNGIFADRGNIIRLSFQEFLLEILRFNALAKKELEERIDVHRTLSDFVKDHRLSEDVFEKYILPLIGSIWSTPKKLAKNFPLAPLLTFLDRHQLLNAVGHPKWHTVVGGSREYVKKMIRDMSTRHVVFEKKSRVLSISRAHKDEVLVVTNTGSHYFDYVVVATHADSALKLLQDASRTEEELLSSFKYETNHVYLHSDTRLMPRRKEAWAAWNYLGYSGWGKKTEKTSLTYFMNELQHLRSDTQYFVSLNPRMEPKKSLMHQSFLYTHPIYSTKTTAAQKRLFEIQNVNKTLFCGSYFGYGFHEDGIASAVEACRSLGVSPPWSV